MLDRYERNTRTGGMRASSEMNGAIHWFQSYCFRPYLCPQGVFTQPEPCIEMHGPLLPLWKKLFPAFFRTLKSQILFGLPWNLVCPMEVQVRFSNPDLGSFDRGIFMIKITLAKNFYKENHHSEGCQILPLFVCGLGESNHGSEWIQGYQSLNIYAN